MISSGNIVLYLVLLTLCLSAAAFFCISETAFISLSKLRLRHLVSTSAANAERVLRIVERPERFLAGVLLGINLSESAVAVLGTLIAVYWWGENLGAALATIIIAVVTLVVAEMVPKSIGIRYGERLALTFVRPVELILMLLYPFVQVLGWIGRLFSRLGGAADHKPLLSEAEIMTAVRIGQAEGVVEEAAANMVHKVFEFGDRQVKEAMIPRPEVVWVEKGTKLKDFLTMFSEHPYSRFPIYDQSIDNIVGVLAAKDIMMAQGKGQLDGEFDVTTLTRPAPFVPETKRLGELLTEMQAAGQQMSVVIDEYGGTAGIITMEQVVAEVVGELGDDLVKAGKEFDLIDEHTFSVDGGMHVDEANREMGLNLPEGDYETVAGFVLSLLERIPAEGEQIKYGNLKIIVAHMDGVKIKKLIVSKG
ncbi:MAG: hemolysin family protein [Dehalococcoidia bacterium]|nr:hemolysin family protein [Dehalococcoidia bacterium]